MTIRSSINAAELSRQLSNLEACAVDAVPGAYEDAKALNEFFAEVHAEISGRLKALGLKCDNCDRYREVEAVLYGMIKDANPGCTTFPVSEGFGDAVTNRGNATRERVIAQAANNMEFLKSVGVVR